MPQSIAENPLDLDHLGSFETARSVASRAAVHVPAYSRHLANAGVPLTGAWATLPVTDKHNYLLKNPFADLLSDDFSDTFTIFSSSGSSGRPFYWPQLKKAQKESSVRLRSLLESVYHIQSRRSLAIVGLALGSWIGGEHFSWVLKSLALEVPYPFAVFSPGNRHDEIISMIESAGPYIDQVILFVCPSAIAHLRLRATQLGKHLPLEKMRFIVIGEPFPETVRAGLQSDACIAPGEPAMLSIFGSADTGVLGFESPASVLLRSLCNVRPALSEALGFEGVIPHLFHSADASTLLEVVDSQLCVTKWQGIPLVRYNLHDAARLLSWKAMLQRACAVLKDAPEAALLQQALGLPDLLAVTGRADSCLLLCGTNLTEAMLDTAVRAPELARWLTGNYRAAVVLENGRQRLEMRLETREGISESADTTDAIYGLLVAALGRVQPEFKDDWDNIYRRWDKDPALRILSLKMAAWPALAGEAKIKQRGIQS